MKSRIAYDVTITIQSPFLFQGLANKLLGVDAAQLRDEDGKPIIPADQARGVLREALGDLNDGSEAADGSSLDFVKELQIFALFGNESAKAAPDKEQDRPDRGALIFSDLVGDAWIGVDGATKPLLPDGNAETTRIAIDDETGAVKTGHIQVIELVAPLGAAVTFRGAIVAFWDGDAEKLRMALDAALKLAPSIGAFKSAGFGEIVASAIALNKDETVSLGLPSSGHAAPSKPLFYRVTFDRPILADAQWVADNAFEGAAVVPGAVFKGALAQRLEDAGEPPETGRFAETLAALRISHAFPEGACGQPSGRALPLSLVALKDGDEVLIGDALDLDDGEGALINGKAAFFIPDWKDEFFPKGLAEFERPPLDEPAKLPRTHTKIGAGGVADDQQLFTTIARSTRRPAGWPPGSDNKRAWMLSVDAAGVKDAVQARQLVALLEAGLDRIGKTGARAAFERIDGDPPAAAPIIGTDDFAIVLETPALMIDPRMNGESSERVSVREQYKAYFAEVLPEAELVNFFASQRLAGRYVATRRRLYGETYYPFVLTDAGSVFRLRAKGDQAALRKKLDDLIRSGLPVRTLRDAPAPAWKNCPFVPENGYGAISANYLSTAEEAALLGRVTRA